MMGSDVKSDSGKSRQRKARCFPQGDVSRPMSGGQFEQQRRVPVKNKTLHGGWNGQSSLLQPPTVPPFEFNSETRCFLDTPVFIGGRDEVRGQREISSVRQPADHRIWLIIPWYWLAISLLVQRNGRKKRHAWNFSSGLGSLRVMSSNSFGINPRQAVDDLSMEFAHLRLE